MKMIAQSHDLCLGLTSASVRESRGDRLVLIATAAADTDRADDRSVTPQGDAAGEDHHAPVVGCVDAKELLARLTIFGELRSFDIEGARRERLGESRYRCCRSKRRPFGQGSPDFRRRRRRRCSSVGRFRALWLLQR
jgi:hypothetical protein